MARSGQNIVPTPPAPFTPLTQPQTVNNNTQGIVVGTYNNAYTMSRQALQDALSFLTQLQNTIASVQPPIINPTFSIPNMTSVAVPNYPTANFNPGTTGVAVGQIDGLLQNLKTDLLTQLNNLNITIPGPPPVGGYVENVYTGLVPYVTDLENQLDTWVNGAYTGLDPTVEAALWNRGRSREVTTFMTKTTAAIRQFALRGFTKPQGALSVELQDAAQTMQDTLATQSREVAVKQAELMQANRRFAFETQTKVQEMMIQYQNAQMNRVVDWQKTMADYNAKVFQAQAMIAGYRYQAFNAIAQAYGQVYATDMQAHDHIETANIGANAQVYDSTIQTQVSLYSAQVNAAIAQFKAQVDELVALANLQIEVGKENVLVYMKKAELTVEAIKGGAQVSAQLASASLAGFSISAGINDSTSNSIQTTNSTSESYQVGQSYQWGATDSTSTSVNLAGDEPLGMSTF